MQVHIAGHRRLSASRVERVTVAQAATSNAMKRGFLLYPHHPGFQLRYPSEERGDWEM